ncbi:pre-mrna processing factor 4 -like protein [Stemphylium lycopersici]|uniref:Pre-mrna processing factor 4-like protein n=1 Tax=Stemphylium lycopersici TaxID=183478 RepID=A0A364NEU7_STELY|nr:pre-mrna processing factor 4 -like protein [Stemphylium lycopersici]
MDDKGASTRADDVYITPQKKGGVMNKLYPPGEKPGAKGRMKNHCRKFWWCDCLVFAIIILVIVLPIIYVAIPKKAQSEINASTIEVTSQEVTDPHPDGIHLKLDTVIKSDSSYHPTIDAFRAALSLEGQEPFLYINIPEVKSESETPVSVEQDVEFASKEAFSEYTKTVLASVEFDVHLDGKPNIHLSGLPTMDVNYNKVVTMKGLNKLSGLNITDVKILSGDSILDDNSNLIANVSIPNPSVMTLDLGNVTMNLAVDGTEIGYSLIPNLLLKPGDNQFPLQSRVDQLAILGLIQSKYSDGVLPLEIVGNSSIKDGEHLTYYEDAIKSNTINLNLDVGPALAGIGINITSFGSG